MPNLPEVSMSRSAAVCLLVELCCLQPAVACAPPPEGPPPLPCESLVPAADPSYLELVVQELGAASLVSATVLAVLLLLLVGRLTRRAASPGGCPAG